jgi:hypothetical protein
VKEQVTHTRTRARTPIRAHAHTHTKPGKIKFLSENLKGTASMVMEDRKRLVVGTDCSFYVMEERKHPHSAKSQHVAV